MELIDSYYLIDPKNLISYWINSVLLYFETKFHLKMTRKVFFNKIDNFAKIKHLYMKYENIVIYT